jgi:glycosyltransferase involved in cell wall biosynthesis
MNITPPVLIIIPTYNEEGNIKGVLKGLTRYASEYDRIFVDDGSKDQTAAIIKKHGEKLLSLPCNLGYGRALRIGMAYALKHDYKMMVFFDSDGQHKPSYISPLIRELKSSDAEMIIGSRFLSAQGYKGPILKNIGIMIFSYIVKKLTGKRIYDCTSGLKVINDKVCKILAKGVFADFHAESLINLLLRNIKIHEYPITVKERIHGHSMNSVLRTLSYPLITLFLILVNIVDVYMTKEEELP